MNKLSGIQTSHRGNFLINSIFQKIVALLKTRYIFFPNRYSIKGYISKRLCLLVKTYSAYFCLASDIFVYFFIPYLLRIIKSIDILCKTRLYMSSGLHLYFVFGLYFIKKGFNFFIAIMLCVL